MQSLAELLPVGPEDDLTHRGARRQAARYPVHASVAVTSPREATGVVLNGSAGGLRVALDRELHVGERVELELSYAGDKTSHERAEVVWTRQLTDGWLVGLSF